MGLARAVRLIKRSKYFLITTHTNAEGDALGSLLAFYRLVQALGKKAVMVTGDKVPYGYDFIPGINKVRKLSPKLRQIKFDCFVALDCSDLARCGGVRGLNQEKRPVINIDHHISNDRFGDINWVEPHCSSTSEMIYRLYKEMRLPYRRDTALALYTGMMTDTGSFRYPNTTSFTHQAVAELLKCGLNVTAIHKSVYENIPLPDARLLSRILPGMKEELGGKIIWFEIKRGLLI